MYLDTNGAVKAIFFFTNGAADPLITNYQQSKGLSKYVKLFDVDLKVRGIFVAKRVDGTASILQVGSDGVVKNLHEWTEAAEDVTFSGFIDRDGKAHVSRYAISKVFGVSRESSKSTQHVKPADNAQMASMSTYSVEATEYSEAGTMFASTFNYSPGRYGRMLHVTAEIAPRKSASLVARICVTAASGNFQGWLGSTLQWDRPEGLAHITSGLYAGKIANGIAFLPLTSSKLSNSSNGSAISLLPSQFQHSLSSLSSSLSAQLRSFGLLPPTKTLSASTGRDWLSEAFGYRKLVVMGTALGKIYALDLGGGGKTVWDHYLAPLDLTKGWKSVEWKKMAVFDSPTDGRVLLIAIAVVQNANVRLRAISLL